MNENKWKGSTAACGRFLSALRPYTPPDLFPPPLGGPAWKLMAPLWPSNIAKCKLIKKINQATNPTKHLNTLFLPLPASLINALYNII